MRQRVGIVNKFGKVIQSLLGMNIRNGMGLLYRLISQLMMGTSHTDDDKW